MQNLFRQAAARVSKIMGSPWMFMVAVLLITTWAVSGPFFNFSNTWQLIINTFTTITTFLMVFLIQNTQNRDTKAIHLKLDELVRAVKGARLSFLDSEEFSDEELEKQLDKFKTLHKKYEDKLAERRRKRRRESNS